MNGIDAYFSGSNVYFSGNRIYIDNLILVEYLNATDKKHLETYIKDFEKLLRKLELTYDMEYDCVKNYYKNTQQLERLVRKVDDYMRTLPPYDMTEADEKTFIYEDIFRDFSFIFEDVGYDDKEEYVIRNSYIIDDYDAQAIEVFEAINKRVKEYVQPYVDYLTSLNNNLKFIQNIIDNFLSERISFPESKELSSMMDKAFSADVFNRLNAGCSMNKFEYTVIKDKKNIPTLCERIIFNDIGSFLYYDFFRGVNNKCFPIKCKNCGKYFLLEGGKFTQYCDNKIKGTNGSTCRSIGARQRYADKCKSDPILGTYEKAYKAHYARVMKKKMSKKDFSEWVPYAQELKKKAYEKEIEFEEYKKKIKE